MSLIPVADSRARAIREEGQKVFAFLRRDFLTAFSYRLPFVTDWLSLLLQILIFAYIGKLIPPSSLPTYNGLPVDYLEFVAVGVTISSFIAVGLSRLSTALRQEQVQGTLEVLLLTPTAWGTIQLGSAFYDILYVPVRTVIFLGLTTLVFGAHYETTGVIPALVVLIAFIPCVWGLGVVSASATLTFRRGSGGIGILVSLATLGSGTFVPMSVLPGAAQSLAAYNPIAIAVGAMRDALLGGATFADVLPAIARLVPMSTAAMILGALAFRWALARERRHGTLGLY
jgi:ABC-type polysaccharide/polyol phosphate export permease